MVTVREPGANEGPPLCLSLSLSHNTAISFLTEERRGKESEKILLLLRRQIQHKRAVCYVYMSCRQPFDLSLSRPHHVSGLTGGNQKEFKETVADHFYFFLTLFLSMDTQCQNERTSSFVSHFCFLCEQGAMFRFL